MIVVLLALVLAGLAFTLVRNRSQQPVPDAQAPLEEDWPMPPDLIAEHTAILENGESPEQWRPVRLRGPNERGPTRAQVKRFTARTTTKRARSTNKLRLTARRIAARRVRRQRRARRTTRSAARCRSPASSDPPPARVLAPSRGAS